MKDADLHPKDHSIQLFTEASNEGWGAHLEQASTKGLWSDREKRLHINVLELNAVSLALQSFKDKCQNQTVFVAMDNSTVVAYINKQGGTHSVEMSAPLWKIMTWCHHYQITLKARHIPECLNVMADLLFRSNLVQSTEWSLHPQVHSQICQKWFTPHVEGSQSASLVTIPALTTIVSNKGPGVLLGSNQRLSRKETPQTSDPLCSLLC